MVFPPRPTVVDFSKLYLMESSTTSKSPVELNLTTDEAIAVRVGRPPPNPIKGRWTGGSRKPNDAIWMRASFLINERFRRILEGISATGYAVVPCEITSRKGEPFGGYSFLQVLGKCAPIDDTKSILVEKEYPAGRFPAYKGLFFEEGSWDSSDIFSPLGFTMTVVTERVAQILKSEKIRGVEFVPLTEIYRSTLPNPHGPNVVRH